jgi:hypothetical protein
MHTMIPANDGAFGVAPGDQSLSMSGHDEERVVDAHPQPDQEHQLGGELRHLEEMAERADDADGRSEREESRNDREEGGVDRSEDE